MNTYRDRLQGRWSASGLTLPPVDAHPLGQNAQGDWVYIMEDGAIAHFYIVYPGYLDTWDGPKDDCPPRFHIV